MEEINKEEINATIKDLWNKGYTPSIIGKKLKEEKNIDFKKLVGKKITKYSEEIGLKLEIPEELLYLFKKVNRMLKHLEENRSDVVTKKDLEELEKRIRSLIVYYKKKGKIPNTFEYSRDVAKMYGSV